MSTHFQLIASTPHGCLFTCDVCDALHLEFGMIAARFEYEPFTRFHQFVAKLDIEALLEQELPGARAPHVRIGLPPTNLALALTRPEIESLQHLLHEGWMYLQRQHQHNGEMEDLFAGIESWLNSTDPHNER